MSFLVKRHIIFGFKRFLNTAILNSSYSIKNNQSIIIDSRKSFLSTRVYILHAFYYCKMYLFKKILIFFRCNLKNVK